MPELLVSNHEPKDKILLSDLVEAAFGMPWWWCAHPSEFIALPWYCFGVVLVHVDQVLDGRSVRRLFWYLRLSPINLTAFLIAKFRNCIPLVRNDSLIAPAI
ncbi:hypothetical protein [Microcoleus sp. herbarium12]|uniref:hypothetical protein n=1 Tax=Microcoleus sp. herbarium12 TaxID=3055437 RepID=UPI002FCE7DCC